MPAVCVGVSSAVKESLERLNLGSPVTLKGMTVWPLLGPNLDGSAYDMLDNAMQKGTCEIREQTSPTVDTVVVVNNSDKPVLAIHGQLLKGAKQNRSLNLTTMFSPQSETQVHVACVEQGRWNAGRSFEDARWMQSAAGRTEKLGDVLTNLSRNGSSKAQQDRVWTQQSIKERRLGLQSDTHDEIEIQKINLRDISGSIRQSIVCEADQVGAIFLANNTWAIEIFDNSDSYMKCHESLLNSFLLEAKEALKRGISVLTLEPRTLIDKAWTTEWIEIAVPGMGVSVTGRQAATKSCALVLEGVGVSVSVSGFLSQA